MADFSGPVTAGRIIEPVSVVQADLAASGFLEEEFFASGTAHCYAPAGFRRRPTAGKQASGPVQSGPAAPFLTRVVVRRPADA